MKNNLLYCLAALFAAVFFIMKYNQNISNEALIFYIVVCFVSSVIFSRSTR